MPSLLSIPLELREAILELALCTPSSPPARSELEARKPETAEREHESMAWSFGYTNTLYEDDRAYSITGLPLLLVNRQLSAETKYVLARMRKSLTYHLDVVLMDERYVLPTWLCVPTLSDHVENVVATIRVLGLYKRKEYRYHSFAGGDGGPPHIVWCFYALLERFFKYGPVNATTPKKERRTIVQNLVLNFVDTDDTRNDPHLRQILSKDLMFHHWYEPRRPFCDGVENPWLRDCYLRPEWFAYFLGIELMTFLTIRSVVMTYGDFMFEQAAMVELHINGKFYTCIDITKRLVKYDGEDYLDWKMRTMEKRKKAGLPLTYRRESEMGNDPAFRQWFGFVND
ncbi:hypothetical protein LOZ53_002800 [Ophidiomyces ophidiicola]|uniref:Uncharacterized protein n=1 Tax=Ophidiomyces ophidiicola TaxID=1387563 RepID=A0ACB8US30_9EURO|nr:uncharacterized protein LOZ57_003640 [Ophidiomyces ophidiicola]KAI1922618.1 hypothetical protein LOZ64_001176 [Ophidiomyces ophidiicola]KAI1946385.1 hypothetical protein LOZ57_003640 [Ophidiomyces ophidiicola]KAI1949977.1 hypothetical protein LOZ62_002147 [Ophidiomyces ophidiicola]KAI1978867.1 hypothetical protein LOZ55_002380 [Ophidiomyces ophidiicola]KAI1991608.1 hypothetical protein LOZ53_002800 [Ophidiomyces ophidiicola]